MRARILAAGVLMAALVVLSPTPASADHTDAFQHWGHGFAPWVSADCTIAGGTFCSYTGGAENAWEANSYPNGWRVGNSFRGCNFESGWIKVCVQTADNVRARPGCQDADGCAEVHYRANEPTKHIDTVQVSICDRCGTAGGGTYFPNALQSLVTHEYGHAIGLGHTADATSVMHPIITPGSGPIQHDRDSLAWAYERVTAGEVLGPDQLVRSSNRAYYLVMQGSDGHLVMYGPSGAVWASGSVSGAGTVTVMQGDGNVVQIRPGNIPVCSFRTSGHPGAFVRIQNDGNLVVYDGSTPIWAKSWGSRCT